MTAGHSVCPASHAGMLDHPVRRLLQSPRRIIGRYIRSGDRVLDIGCVPGYFSLPMARMIGESGCVVAADLQVRAICPHPPVCDAAPPPEKIPRGFRPRTRVI